VEEDFERELGSFEVVDVEMEVEEKEGMLEVV
jgi:hypothetical protein